MGTMTQMLPCLAALVAWPLRAQIPAPAIRAALTVTGPFAWQTATPESQGMSSQKLDALQETLAAKKTKAFLVMPSLKLIMVRNGETLAPGPGEPPVRNDDVFTKYHDYRVRILFEALSQRVPGGLNLAYG